MPTGGVELCCKLRSWATRRILEFSFCPRQVDQHCVQPLRTQYQECEHKHEEHFHAETHDSLLGYAVPLELLVVLEGFSSSAFIADLKPRIPSPMPLPSSGSFLGPKTSNAIPKISRRCVG